MFLHPVTPLEIWNIVHTLKANKSAGIDNVSPKVLKSVFKCIAEPLSAIFNNSLTESVIPDMLKIAKVVPIYKSDDKFSIGNYRPVSVLPTISKILERLMYNRLYEYFE